MTGGSFNSNHWDLVEMRQLADIVTLVSIQHPRPEKEGAAAANATAAPISALSNF